MPRPPFTAKQKREHSERMRKMWERRRKALAKENPSTKNMAKALDDIISQLRRLKRAA